MIPPPSHERFGGPGALDTLRERFGVDIRELAGAHAAGEIPLSDDLLNRLIAGRLANHPQVASVRLQAQEGDTIDVLVTPRARLMPPMRITARIERQPEFPQHPLLVLRWTMPAIGPLAMFAAPALAFFKALPPGLRADGDRITVDVGEVLESRGLGEVGRFIRRAEVHTRPGGFVLQFELAVS